MLDTAKELHIGIDLGLQAINSNRKLNIEPAEKDWVLNNVLMQEINSRINPKSNVKSEGFEDTFQRIDDLESIKVDTSEISNFPIYKYSDKAVYVPLPADYYRLIETSANVNNLGSINSPVVNFNDFSGVNGVNYRTHYGIVKLPSSSSINYSNFKFSFCYNATGIGLSVYDEVVLFNINERGDYVGIGDYYIHGIPTIASPYYESKFMFIRLVMDYVNEHVGKEYGITVYWERFTHIYQKDSFIVVIDNSIILDKIPDFDPTIGISFLYLSISGNNHVTPGVEDIYVPTYATEYYDYNRDSIVEKFDKAIINDTNYYSLAQKAAYNNIIFNNYPVRIVKSSILNDLLKHYYGKPVYNSPIGVIKQGRLVVYHDGTFEFNRIDLEYYRRPKLISIYNNQGCEITSESFKMELVEKTVQKLSARIQDPNYKNLLQENLILG